MVSLVYKRGGVGVVVGERGVPKEHCGIARPVAYLSVLCHLIV